jgi:hypothetical protein
MGALLRANATNLVCVHGEANVWPARRLDGPPPEIVHWVARRAGTGETFEAIIAPRRPLAPSIPGYIGVAPAQLAAGESWASFRARWESFLRPGDFACTWGRYASDLVEAEGVALPTARLDLRPIAGTFLGARTGTVEECSARMGLSVGAPVATGRGGTRLAALSAIVDRMLAL